MQLTAPAISIKQGGFFEQLFLVDGEIPQAARASAYITPLMGKAGNIMLECQIDREAGGIKIRLNSVKSSKMSPGRYSYTLELQMTGNKAIGSNYLLVEP